MTILEAVQRRGYKELTTSFGDSLRSVVNRIYKSDDALYYMIIQTLNNRFDWDCIEPGSVIRYIPKSICSEINEITSRR